MFVFISNLITSVKYQEEQRTVFTIISFQLNKNI